jgi:protease I
LLVSAGLVRGKRLTSFHTIQDDMRNAGAEWIDEPIVLDDNLITSRKPDDLSAFNDAIITALS